jgi:hypothetical protein
MREALGLDQPSPQEPKAIIQVAIPVESKTADKRHTRAAKTPTETTPQVKPSTAKPTRSYFKRQIEVILYVQRADGSVIPFYHCDPGTSSLEAEINATKKARSFNLRVVGEPKITVKEYDCRV